jgi:predicted nucleotidyltransferase
MKNFKSHLRESIIDPDRQINSVAIFDLGSEIRLKHNVRTQILAGISKLSRHMTIKDYSLIGSILTTRFTEDSDVDVNILVADPDDKMEEIRAAAIQNSGKFIEGTKHPVNFHVLNDESDFKNANDSADAVFDISSNQFIRRPVEQPFYVEKYMNRFKQVVSEIDLLKKDLADDLIDYNYLKSLPKNSVSSLADAIEKELKSAEKDAVGLATLYNGIKKDRADAFSRNLTNLDIREYGAKNRLPENVLYKLLERHQYLNFLHKVKEILGDDNKLSPKEAERLSDVVSKY